MLKKWVYKGGGAQNFFFVLLKNSYIVFVISLKKTIFRTASQRPDTDIDDDDKEEEDENEDGSENKDNDEFETDSSKMFEGLKNHRYGKDSTISELDMNFTQLVFVQETLR